MNKVAIIFSLCSFCSLYPLVMSAQVVLRNDGAMHVGVGSSTALYIAGAMEANNKSDIVHPGGTILTGDLINNVTEGNVFNNADRGGTFKFNGQQEQKVWGKASKANNYIAFPNTVVIDNTEDEKVSIAGSQAASMKIVTFSKGRLVLESEFVDNNASNESRVAHLFLEDNALTSTIDNSTGAQGRIEVDLLFGAKAGRLMGFTPPFKKMYSDYFFFNFLSIPSEVDLFNGNGNDLWNTDPHRALTAGTGYILGMGLVPHTNTSYYNNTKDTQYSTASLSEAATTEFNFNRRLLISSSPTFGSFVNEGDSYIGEALINDDVSITLYKGFNYLGNPYMVPLNVADLLTGSRTDWGIGSEDIAKQYYVLSKGSTGTSTDGETFTFNATYLVGQVTGSTNETNPYQQGDLIAPMQMFVIKNNGGPVSTFKIPRSKRTHGATNFLRSAAVNEPDDELLLEARDKTTGGFDRLCVVFRQSATLHATDTYDAEKLFNRTGGVNQIYTRSTDGKELTTSVIPATTVRLPFYFEPSLERQEVEIEASRLESLHSVYDVIIEDTKMDTKTSFFENPVYAFTSSPGDSPTRFVLHFSSATGLGTEEVTESKLVASYQNSAIYVQGLKVAGNTEKDNEVKVYNTKGQLILTAKISAESMQLPRYLDAGVYLVNAQGQSVKLFVRN